MMVILVFLASCNILLVGLVSIFTVGEEEGFDLLGNFGLSPTEQTA